MVQKALLLFSICFWACIDAYKPVVREEPANCWAKSCWTRLFENPDAAKELCDKLVKDGDVAGLLSDESKYSTSCAPIERRTRMGQELREACFCLDPNQYQIRYRSIYMDDKTTFVTMVTTPPPRATPDGMTTMGDKPSATDLPENIRDLGAEVIGRVLSALVANKSTQVVIKTTDGKVMETTEIVYGWQITKPTPDLSTGRTLPTNHIMPTATNESKA
ncbi:hypothetical protein TWF281_005503 [Arthrobotrys megalospora]